MDGGAQVAVPATLGVFMQHSARSKYAGGKKSLRVRAVQILGQRNVVQRSVLCDSVRGKGHKMFMDRWLWAVGTVTAEGTEGEECLWAVGTVTSEGTEGEECHVVLMLKWNVKCGGNIFKRGTSENKTPTVADRNRRETGVD